MAAALAVIIAIVAWASLALQFAIIVSGHSAFVPGMSPTTLGRAFNFFSYFTILSNILVALLATTRVLAPAGRLGRFLVRPAVAASVELNIAVTGIIYVLILRPLWNPEGLQLLADTGLHYTSPVLFSLYWLSVLPKGRLGLTDIPAFIVFPLAYGAYTLGRGAVVDWYPYPFVSVVDLGYPRTLANMAGLAVLFAVLGAVLVLIDRLLGRIRSDG